MLLNGEVAAELLYKKRAKFEPSAGMGGPPSNNNEVSEFRVHEVDVVRLRSTENLPRAFTWATRMEVLLVGTNRADRSFVHDVDALGESYTGGRFLFLWLPSKAAHAYHELQDHPDHRDEAIAMPPFEPTPDYQPAAGFSGEVSLGPTAFGLRARRSNAALEAGASLSRAPPCSMRAVRRAALRRLARAERGRRAKAPPFSSQGLRGERLLAATAVSVEPGRKRRAGSSSTARSRCRLPPAKRMRVQGNLAGRAARLRRLPQQARAR